MQIAWNLVHNAAKFTPARGRLAMRTRNVESTGLRVAQRLVVEFEDTGQGIEPEMLPGIFEPFEQGRTAVNPRSTGLGLGLSICRSLAVAHGGSLETSSAGPGLGANFRLVLELVASPPAGTSSAAPPELRALRRPLNILLVEDNRDTLKFLAMILSYRGHQVRKAMNLAEARASVSGDLDLLISDIELPDGTGLELMRELGGGDAVPGIAMSGFGSEEDVGLSQEAGFAVHLIKPIDVARLEAAIQQVCAGVGRTQPIDRAGSSGRDDPRLRQGT
jgi:CheY-like chemotaxis protein